MLRFKKNNNTNQEEGGRIFLEESFYVSANKKNVFNVKLSERGLVLTKHYKDGKEKAHFIPPSQIIGVRCLTFRPNKAICLCGGRNQSAEESRRERLSTEANDAYLYIYTYTTKNRRNNRSIKERNTIALRFRSFDKFEQNAEEANKWKTSLLTLLNQNREKLYKRHLINKGYLIFLNPKSGKGKARTMFHKIVAPGY